MNDHATQPLAIEVDIQLSNLRPTLATRIQSVLSYKTLTPDILAHKMPKSHNLPFTDNNKTIDVSIVIPVFNEWQYTKKCINSIINTYDPRLNIEIILADDASTDDTSYAREVYPDLIINKMHSNIGFLKNCNAAIKIARGRCVFLLNNDTIMMPNALFNLYHTLENQSDCVIAGPKILNLNGTIQEAGAIVYNTGKVRRIGEGFPRFTPEFNVPRETHYISGCALLIKKSFWDAIQGFDERYDTAYYEDTDLAMTAHAHGYKVIYQPKAEIIHFSSKSYKKNRKQLCKTNSILFLNKWSKQLPTL